MIKTHLITFFVALLCMLIIDGIWLSSMLKRFYAPHISHLMAEKASLAPAALFYVIYIFALTSLILYPAVINQHSLYKTILQGALFGFAAYATYDLTNQATLKNWSALLSAVDMCWGAVLTGTVSGLTLKITQHFS